MSNGSTTEECVEEKKQLSMWKKIGVVCGAIVALGGVATLWYQLDCYLTVVHGDTAFATDADLKKERETTDVDLEKLREQLKLEQSIRKTKDKIRGFKGEYRSNLLFIEQVRRQYPVKEDIPGYNSIVPSGLFKEYRKAKKDNEKLEKKIEDWEKNLHELELKEIENGT
jgi:hypothetical protein